MKSNFIKERNHKSILIVGILVFLSTLLHAQDENTDSISTNKEFFWSHKKEIALNMTNLAKLFVPLNFTPLQNQDVVLKAKWYGRKYALRLDFGAKVVSQVDLVSTKKIYLAVGYEKRKMIYNNKWFYTNGFSLVVNSKGMGNNSYAGVLNHYGLEYNLNPSITLGADAGLVIGKLEDGIGFLMLPPSAIFLQARF